MTVGLHPQILTAKNKQLAANPNDQERALQVRLGWMVLLSPTRPASSVLVKTCLHVLPQQNPTRLGPCAMHHQAGTQLSSSCSHLVSGNQPVHTLTSPAVPPVHAGAAHQIEAAYDVLFMQSMKKRISGELEVSSSVRYADVPSRKRSSSVSMRVPCVSHNCIGWRLQPPTPDT